MTGPIRVAVDALGGDHGPEEIVAGAVDARSDRIEPVLFGPAGLVTHGLELVVTTQVIAMDEKPADAVRGKPDSSLVAACRAVHEGQAAAVVSAGNTGAMLAAGLVYVRRLRGVLRPAIAVVIPTPRGPSVLIDAGANADCRAEHLLQFALMGSVFAQEILDVPSPTVALLSIGEEPEKGNQLTLEAHELLERSDLRFEGNVESRGVLAHAADVVVCDGFTGNVVLKTMEGTIRTTLDWLRSEITATARGKVGGVLIKPAAARLRAQLDPDDVRRRVPARTARAVGDRPREFLARAAIANAIRHAAHGIEPRRRHAARLSECAAAEAMAGDRVSIRALSESNPQER